MHVEGILDMLQDMSRDPYSRILHDTENHGLYGKIVSRRHDTTNYES